MLARHATLVLIALSACERGDHGGPPERPPATTAAHDAAPEIALDDPPPAPIAPAVDAGPPIVLSKAELAAARKLARLIAKLVACPKGAITTYDPDCPELERFRAERDRHQDDARRRAVAIEALRAHLDHPDPRLRRWTLERALSDDGDLALAAAIIDAESDAHVLQDMLHLTYLDGEVDGPLASSVLARTDHPVREVARMAFWSLAKQPPYEPGVVEKMIATIERGTDDATRAEACRVAGWTGDARLVPVFDRMLVATTDAAVHDRCLHGLVEMWVHAVPGSRKAYRRTLAFLERGRRDTSAADAMSTLGDAADRRRRGADGWAAKTWVSFPELAGALTSFILDRSGDNAPSRASAVQALALISREALTALRSKLKPGEVDGDDLVASCVDAELAAAGACEEVLQGALMRSSMPLEEGVMGKRKR